MSKTTEHKEGKATVKIYYKVSKTLADGTHPFQIRITKNRKQVFRSTGLSLHPKYWNAAKQEIRKSYPEPGRDKLLLALEAWRAKFAAAASALADDDEQHEAETVIRKVSETRKATRRVKLLAYCDELSEGFKRTGKDGNASIYRDLRNQLAKFIAAENKVSDPPTGRNKAAEWAEWLSRYDVPFERVNATFCYEWEQTLRATGVKEITLSLRFRTLRAVLNQAIATGVMKAEAYPFARTVAEKHKMQVGKFDVSTAKRAISLDELRRFNALVPATEQQRLAKDVFLFSYYCGGINFVDLAQLHWHDLSGQHPDTAHAQRLHYTRQKTGGKFSLKLTAQAAALIATYRPLTCATPASYVFPILDPTRHHTPTQIKNRLHKVLGQINKNLKALGEQANIATPLTTYVARHSFATVLKMDGNSTAVISQALGHKSEAVTAVYLDSFSSEMVEAAYESLTL